MTEVFWNKFINEIISQIYKVEIAARSDPNINSAIESIVS